MKQLLWILVVAVLGLAGWYYGRGLRRGPIPGGLRVSWTGADTAKFQAPLTGVWCGREHFLELSAVRSDTGVALLLRPSDSLVPGEYPVVSPTADSSTLPRAGVAARWFTETTIAGYRADSGSVVLDPVQSGHLSGRVGARLRSTGSGTVWLKGTFEGVTLAASPLRCPSDSLSPKPDSGVS